MHVPFGETPEQLLMSKACPRAVGQQLPGIGVVLVVVLVVVFVVLVVVIVALVVMD